MIRPLLAAVLAAALVHAAPAEEVQTSGAFDKLVGPGGSAALTVDPYPDGTQGGVKAVSKEGAFQKLDAKGSVRLKTDTLDLRATNLEMDVQKQILIATGNVSIDQQGMQATCERLEYRIEERQILMTGNPAITQQTESGSMKSSGMEELIILIGEDGSTAARMERGKIRIEMEQKEPAGGATPTPAAGAPARGGMSSLGRSTRIDVNPRGDQHPTITLTSSGADLDQFRALGSVRVKTDEFDLRADQLEFSSAANTMTALHNVFLRQQGIEADCGRLLYDLNQAVITLSVNPVVRQDGDGGRTTVSRTEQIVLRKGTEGETLAEFEGTPKFDFQPSAKPAVARQDKPSTGPVEIILDDRKKGLPEIPAR